MERRPSHRNFGALYTLVVALFGSVWPAIALHALVDLAAGAMEWLVLRDDWTQGGVVELEPSAR